MLVIRDWKVFLQQLEPVVYLEQDPGQLAVPGIVIQGLDPGLQILQVGRPFPEEQILELISGRDPGFLTPL
ncbi:MAG: hypothetical protein ACOCY9_00500 [Desulfohalobiaceae bacterium]